MFCSKCGTQNDGNSNFCLNCGESLKQEPAESAVTYQAFSQTNSKTTQSHLRSPYPAINILKNIGASPLFLAGVIAFTLSIIFTAITSFSQTSTLLDQLYEIQSELGLDFNLDSYYTTIFDNVGFITAFISMIPSVITAVGLWLIYAAAAEKKNYGISTVGLTILQVMKIISLVYICIVTALFIGLIVMLIVFTGKLSDYYFMPDYVKPIIIAASVFVCATLALCIVYTLKIITTIGSAKKTAITGIANNKASVFVAVMNFILAGLSLFSLINTYDFYNVLAVLGSVTSLICFGIVILNYKNAMTPLTMLSAIATENDLQSNITIQ